MQIRLRRFDMGSIKKHCVCLMLGKRNTGKSFLVKDMLSFHSDAPAGVVISPTESANHFYSEMFPPIFIHEEYSPAIIDNVVKRQRQIVRKVQDNPNIDPRCVLIMDDCLYDGSWTHDKNIRQIFLNGRHLKLMFILTSQYAMGVTPMLRSNIDYVFILRENIVSNRKRIYDNYCGMLPSFDAFCSVLDQTTENFECLVVDNTSRSNRIEDQLFYYKAVERPPFQIGSRHLWSINNARLEEDSDDDGEETLDRANARPRGKQLTVRKLV